MEVPRFWRNKGFMLNPNINGYRPVSPVEQIPPSVKITCIKFDGTPDSLARREVQEYSKIIKEPEPVQIKSQSGTIYQDTGVAV